MSEIRELVWRRWTCRGHEVIHGLMTVLRLPCWLHKWYAGFCGYFWVPCVLCGREWGGHEWRDDAVSLYEGDGTGRGVCPRCSEYVAEINREIWVSTRTG